ncbi:MAG TPA: NADH-quinone oxidoreductase subunit A [Gemmatimonadales bacterium]|jgi:NADH-quinone oxidoreductase subunit A|nr:NADH-quinone oxidoreductase subunit A [Gemmatimonadales bacterium]
MLTAYLPLLLVVAFVVANAVMMLGVSRAADLLLKSYKPTAVKLAPYESGMPALGQAGERFSVKFYLVTILFIVFDIEAVFMIPWAVAFRQLQDIGGLLLVEMLVFMLILVVGFVYVWKRGALEWD